MNSSGEVALFQKKFHIEQFDNRECFLQTENSSNRENLVLLSDFFLSASVSELICFILIKRKKVLKPAEVIYSLVL